MLFHVDMIYLAKQAKRDVETNLCFEMRTVTKSNPELDFFSFMPRFSLEQAYFTHGMCKTAFIRMFESLS